jgi:transposase-like protein
MKRKYTILSPEIKEKIIKDYLNGESPIMLSKKYDFTRQHFYVWLKKYQEEGIDGLKSKTGNSTCSNPHKGLYLRKPKNKIEELELELMKKEIEIARLKKGYIVKGVGAKKEFVTTFDKNTK